MKSCPECNLPIESWESAAHKCVAAAHPDGPLLISNAVPTQADLEDAFASWLKKGKGAMTSGQYEDAAECLREAIKRSRALDQAMDKELDSRKALAETLEKLNKLQESADQYRIIAQEVVSPDLKEKWLKKSQDLVASSSSLPYDRLFQKEEFRSLLGDEAKTVNLYCLGCKRLMAEAEVYSFRRAATPFVKCWCGTEGIPLAKQDFKPSTTTTDSTIAPPTSQRARAIAVASKELAGGKKKSTAVVLALLTGWIGGHKFYLGETTAGSIYVVWFWTLIPLLISLYEAIVLMEMSITTFNMTYNIELVLELVQPLDDSRSPAIDVFSMDIIPDALKVVAEAGPSDT